MSVRVRIRIRVRVRVRVRVGVGVRLRLAHDPRDLEAVQMAVGLRQRPQLTRQRVLRLSV